MPDFKTHTNFIKLIFLLTFFDFIVLDSVFGIVITVTAKTVSLCVLWALLHMYFITPDFNWNSTPNKNLGPFGWVARKLIHSHREGFTHSYIFWGLYFVIAFYFLGYWTLSGVIPVFSHLILDDAT